MSAVRIFFGDGNDEAQIGFGHVRLGLETAVGRGAQIFERLQKLLAGHPHELFERLDFRALGFDCRASFRRGAKRFEFLNVPCAGQKFVVDVPRDNDHFFDDFLLVEKFREHLLQFRAHLLQFFRNFFLAALLRRLLPVEIFRIHLLVEGMHFFDELPQIAQMPVAVGNFFVNNDAVEALLWRF